MAEERHWGADISCRYVEARVYLPIMLEMALLGLLKEQPMHGYDLRKRLRSDFGLLASLSFGSLYPALGRLEAEGAVREVTGGADGGWEATTRGSGYVS